MLNRMLKRLCYTSLIVCILASSTLQAGVTGKISGIVIDTKSGDPIVGATVRVDGTNQATQTDIDGEYFIINVPSGKYDITVTSIGFEPLTKKEVRVLVDLTTPVDFDMYEETITLNQNVVVYAENPIIQKDLTASKVIFTAERLKHLPNITTVQSVLTNYPGVVIGRDDNLHVRGGRSGQIAYYFDGFSVQDPFVANSGIKIMPNALEELTLTSGGYTAEYGEALSGVVSAVTRDGGTEYQGSLKMYEGYTSPYNVYRGDWDKIKAIGNKSISAQLSGPIPHMRKGSNNFSIASEYLHDPTSLPHNGIASYTGTAKFSFQPISKIRLVSNLTYYQSQGEIYQHQDVNGVSYDFNLDGLPSFEKESYLIGMSGNYHFDEKTILSARFNHFSTYTKSAPLHLFDTYWSDWPGYSEDSAGVYNGTIDDNNYLNNWNPLEHPEQIVGYTYGDDYYPTFRLRQSKYNAFHLSLINQLNKYHQLKTGLEYRKYSINWDFKQFFNDQPYGEIYGSKPTYFSLFLQDKMEYDYYIINIGLRYDYRDDNIKYNASPQPGTVATYVESESRSRVSPRFGVSFPISTRSVMHFNYGIYYQVPKFTYMYTNLQGEIESGYPLLGNPNLKPERTTAYEIGLDHMLSENIRLDITAYQKDINDLVTTRSYFTNAKNETKNGTPVTTFVNEDFGSAQGIDLQLEKLPGTGLVSASISYSYMIAKGNGSDAYDPYYSYITSQEDTLAPISEYPLDFDQRHTLTAVLDYRVPAGYKYKFLGLNLPTDWGIGFVGYYGSGLPYTPTDLRGIRTDDRNSGRLPANYTVDMKLNKNFTFNKSAYNVSFFIEVDNLFDKRNVINVYSTSGRPDDDNQDPIALEAGTNEQLQEFDALFDKDPLNYSTPRTIRTGLELHF